MISHINGSLTQDAERQFRRSPKWRKYENLLLKLATTQQKEKALETNGAEGRSKAIVEAEEQRTHPTPAERQKAPASGFQPGQFQGIPRRPPKESGGGGIAEVPEHPYFPDLWSRTNEKNHEVRKKEEAITDAEGSRAQNRMNAAAGNTRQATAIGQNIDRLRKESGWSYDDLAAETGIDKKLILSHVNKGARPIPRILREYAQAFSKRLERKIIVPDLEK